MIKKCIGCGLEFKTYKKITKYCSLDCFHRFNTRRIDGACYISKNKLYRTYRSILQRCYNQKDARYKNYGGRGIKCFWKNYVEFKNDMEQSLKEHLKIFGSRNTSIDRIDVNGHYCKENCRWATRKEQMNNTRRSLKVEYQGRILDIHQFSKKTTFNLSPPTVAILIKKGLSLNNIINIRKHDKGKLNLNLFNLKNISKRDKNIILLRSVGINMAEIGRTVGLTRERIRQIISKRIKKQLKGLI